MIAPFGHLVNDYYLELFRKNQEQRRRVLNNIKTKEDFLNYREQLRQKVATAFQLPSEKCELNSTVAKTLDRPGFTVQNLIFQSRPGLFVTANLYIPNNAQNAPAVLFLCGHSENGKACDTYQTAILNLVNDGYVVLCPDPTGQGERSLFENAPMAKETGVLYSPVREHNMLSKQMLLVGEYYASWCLWDVVRSFDLLEQRPEVNPKQICVTGNSGGGNMTAFLAAVDDRPAAIAPSCYISTWIHHLENEEACDAEQEPQFFVGLGCEMPDLLLANAPKPTLILGQKNDFFDARGAKDAYDELKQIYSVLNQNDMLNCFIGDGNHGFNKDNRREMHRFFNRILNRHQPQPEPDNPQIFTDAELQCTPKGQVAYLPGYKNIIETIQEKAQALAKSRPKLDRTQLAKTLANHYDLHNLDTIPYYRILRPARLFNSSPNTLVSRYALETEPNILAILKYATNSNNYCFHFPENLEQVTLYVPHIDAQDEIEKINRFKESDGWFAIDPRGIGESTSAAEYPPGSSHGIRYGKQITTDPFYSAPDPAGREIFAEYSADYHHSACALMLGKPYLCGRIRDIAAAFVLLRHKGIKQIDLVARGQGCIPAAIAALLVNHDGSTTLYRPPESYQQILQRQITPYPQSMMLPNILKFTDMPEIYDAINAKISDDPIP